MGREYHAILSKERKEIKKRLKKERDQKVKLKLVLLNMVALGMSVKDAASFMGIKLRTAYLWINKWIKEGYEGMPAKKRSGRPPKLSKEQKEELKKSLEEKEYWTTKEIGVLIKEKFGVEYKKSRLYINCFNPKNPGQNSFPVLTQRDRELTFTGPSTFIVIFK